MKASSAVCIIASVDLLAACVAPPDGSKAADNAAKSWTTDSWIGLKEARERTDEAHRKFETAIEPWLAGGKRLPDGILFPVKCSPNLDYGAEIYAATDMVIDCLRDQYCRSQYAKNFEPDDIIPLRQGGEDECRERDPETAQKELVQAVKKGVWWRRRVLREEIDERRKLGRGAYPVEKEIADALNDHYLTNIVDGGIGWKAHERYLCLDNLGSLKRHLELLAREDSSEEQHQAACRLKEALRKQEFQQLQEAFQVLWGRQLLNIAAIKKAAAKSCVKLGLLKKIKMLKESACLGASAPPHPN